MFSKIRDTAFLEFWILQRDSGLVKGCCMATTTCRWDETIVVTWRLVCCETLYTLKSQIEVNCVYSAIFLLVFDQNEHNCFWSIFTFVMKCLSSLLFYITLKLFVCLSDIQWWSEDKPKSRHILLTDWVWKRTYPVRFYRAHKMLSIKHFKEMLYDFESLLDFNQLRFLIICDQMFSNMIKRREW